MTKNNKKLKATICITTYNSGDYIQKTLKSLLNQKRTFFDLERLIIISDGSTDNTVSQIKKIKSKKILLINDNKNLGITARINQLLAKSTSDICVLTDSDIIFYNKNTLNNLLYPFLKDTDIALTGGNPASTGKHNFLTRSWLTTKNAYGYIRSQINDGNNIYSCMGGLLAVSKKLYKKINIPNNVYAWDTFMYLTCIKSGFKFRYVASARVRHPLTYTIKGQIKRNKRHSIAKDELSKYFGNMANKEFYIPRSVYLKAIGREFLKHPLESIFIYTVNTYSRLAGAL